MSYFIGSFVVALTILVMPWSVNASWSSEWQGGTWQDEAVAATCKWRCYIDSHPELWKKFGAEKWYKRIRKHWLLDRKACKCPPIGSKQSHGKTPNGHDHKSWSKHGHHDNQEAKTRDYHEAKRRDNTEMKKLRTQLLKMNAKLRRLSNKMEKQTLNAATLRSKLQEASAARTSLREEIQEEKRKVASLRSGLQSEMRKKAKIADELQDAKLFIGTLLSRSDMHKDTMDSPGEKLTGETRIATWWQLWFSLVVAFAGGLSMYGMFSRHLACLQEDLHQKNQKLQALEQDLIDAHGNAERADDVLKEYVEQAAEMELFNHAAEPTVLQLKEEDNRCEFGAPNDLRASAELEDSMDSLGTNLEYEVLTEKMDQETVRLVKIQCPGVAYNDIVVDIIFNGCIVRISRQASLDVEAFTWTKCFQFSPSDGLFEFMEDQAQLEHGFFQLVFRAYRFQKRVFRLPHYLSSTTTDMGPSWMLSAENAAELKFGLYETAHGQEEAAKKVEFCPSETAGSNIIQKSGTALCAENIKLNSDIGTSEATPVAAGEIGAPNADDAAKALAKEAVKPDDEVISFFMGSGTSGGFERVGCHLMIQENPKPAMSSRESNDSFEMILGPLTDYEIGSN